MGWGAFAGAIGGSALDFFSAKQQNQAASDQAAEAMRFSAEQSAKQMQFQRDMSNTAHVREVEDLKNAGLNPLLSLNSGASTPSGSMGTGVSAPVVPEIGAAVGSARESISMIADLKVKSAQATKAVADAGISQEELKYIRNNPNVYFGAKYGSADTAGAIALDSIMRLRKGTSSAKDMLSLPNFSELFSGPGYMSDAEMRKRGKDLMLKKKGLISN